MDQGIKVIVIPVRDIAKAKALYGTLVEEVPYVDEPYYVGYRAGDLEIGFDPNGHAHGMTGPVSYWQVDDIAKSLQGLQDAGAQAVQDVKDVGGGMLTAQVQDADGNVIGLRQPPS